MFQTSDNPLQPASTNVVKTSDNPLKRVSTNVKESARYQFKKRKINPKHDTVCRSSGLHPDDTPRPVFRTVPTNGQCDQLLQRMGGCCIRDLEFTKSVALIVRTANPGIARRRVTSEMLAWIDELYANARPPFADVSADSTDLVLDIQDPDDQLLIDFAIEMQSDEPLAILVSGQDVELNRDLHKYRGPVMVQGYDGNSSIEKATIADIGNLSSPIETLFVEDCLITSPFQNDNATFIFSLLVLMLADKMKKLHLTLPQHVTFNGIEFNLVQAGWTIVHSGDPVHRLRHQANGVDVKMRFDYAKRSVTCDISRI